MKVVVESSPGTTVKITVMSGGGGSASSNPTSSPMMRPPTPRMAMTTEQNIDAGAVKRVRVQVGPSTSSDGNY